MKQRLTHTDRQVATRRNAGHEKNNKLNELIIWHMYIPVNEFAYILVYRLGTIHVE